MAIKLKFDKNNDSMDLYRDKNIITSLNPQEFGSLIGEVRRVMEEANPVIKRKQDRKRERKQLMNNLKILLAIKAIDFVQKIKSVWFKVKGFFKKK